MALAVVNRGEISDAVGAVYGALAGFYYYYETIPGRWVGLSDPECSAHKGLCDESRYSGFSSKQKLILFFFILN